MRTGWVEAAIYSVTLTGLMSLIVSAAAAARLTPGAFQLSAEFRAAWLEAFVASWSVALPSSFLVVPLARGAAAKAVKFLGVKRRRSIARDAPTRTP